MFEDIIKEKNDNFVKYVFPNGTIIVDFDKREVVLEDNFTREEFREACDKICADLGDRSPIIPTEDGWYKIDDGYVSCYPNGLSWVFIPARIVWAPKVGLKRPDKI